MTRTKATTNTKLQSGLQNKDIQDMLSFLEENDEQIRNRENDIKTLRDELLSPEVVKPKAPKSTDSLQAYQVVGRIAERIQLPSSNYIAEGVDPILAGIVRDGVKTVQEEGGLFDSLTGKPSAIRESLHYGDGFIRMGLNKDGKIIYDNIAPDKIFIDANATIMHGKNENRKPTRFAAIYTYDIDKAKQISGMDLEAGEIPRINNNEQDFEKTRTQDSEAEERDVEAVHYFDIGGEEPMYIVAWGEKVTPQKTAEGKDMILKGKDYPFIDENGNPEIPVIALMNIPSEQGFFNIGYLQLFYKFMVSYRELFNKQIRQTQNALTDTSFLNVPKNQSGRIIKAMRDARARVNKGDTSVVINDMGEPVTVSKAEAQAFEVGLENLKAAYDKEFKRVGINMDVIRPTGSATATQILFEGEEGEETLTAYVERNTQAWIALDVQTMNMIRSFISPDDETPIRTTVKMPKVELDETGQPIVDKVTGLPQIEMTAEGLPVMEGVKGITLGIVKQILDENKFFVETNTRSGIRSKNFLQAARGQVALGVAGGDPRITKAAQEAILQSVGFKVPEGEAPPQQPQPTGRIAPKAAEQVGDILTKQL